MGNDVYKSFLGYYSENYGWELLDWIILKLFFSFKVFWCYELIVRRSFEYIILKFYYI